MSPQALRENKYSFKSDIWALGVLYYETLYGEVPWDAPSEKDLVRKMETSPVSFSPNKKVFSFK
jgi:serine/threonine-protein kinase ULK/ATG1